jgi:hypothetical protein
MNHNQYKQWIQLSFYGELSNQEQAELEIHLLRCEECRMELENQKSLLGLIADHKKLQIDEDTLKEARAQLRGALRIERSKESLFGNWADKLFQLISSPPRLAFSVVAVMLIGILIGSFFFGKNEVTKIVTKSSDDNQLAILGGDINISNLQFVDSDPTDGEVEFTFQANKPVYLKGNVNDPKIQSILTYAMLNEQNPGSRLNSIYAMDNQQQLNYDKEVRDAIITVAMTDANPGVRREALKLIKKFPYDETVKQAFLYVLTSDTSSGIRIAALNALIEAGDKGHSFSESELDLFKRKVQNDNNNYIRIRSKTILEEYN